ncbi:lipid II:glycine glycyltransferase FemX [Ornithinicoccus hortensis]|uniref:Lipid II:glycine glycyltransferase (Peptidoglycan interpeptide bridge formation enzyme) n=1 Tax=Ornithinicoccus hortensis TaxID=82346 RepID=A0A542YVW6_9MICO|nr:peptidoglycan bridge formation glycyltransferase FemA/FemB family protein [Ornithinicoccus hortensis]TQL52223.1 lipid II:glycine glycyltransferase (peptidoglycan interpeptide bridge formation enzyme) [Ornithinicoccus hortensis]
MPVSLDPIDDPAEFNRVVAAQPFTSPLQSWGYGEARKVLGQQPMRFLVRRNGSTVGALQLLRKRLVPGLSTLYAPRGPALEDVALLPELAPALRRLAKVTDAYLKVEPPRAIPAASGDVGQAEDVAADQRDVPPAYGAFHRAKTEQPEHTILADLTRPEDELFSGLHKMARRNVRTAQKMGVQAGRDDDFEAFWHIFDQTNTRAQLGAFPRAYYETLFREGNKHGSETYLVLSRHEGQALAGGFFLGLGESTLYLYGGSVRDDRPPAEGQDKRKDAKAPDAFYWNAMLDAKEHGYSVFDFWGIPRVLDESKHSFGVFKMKLKFSTDRYWFPAYDLRLSPVATPVVKALHARRKLLNYRSRGTTDDIL